MRRLELDPLEGRPNILRPPDFEWHDFEAELAGRGVNLTRLRRCLGTANISQYCQSPQARDDLAQQFETLAGDITVLQR